MMSPSTDVQPAPSDWTSPVAPLLVVILGPIGAAVVILLGGHASQADPQIAHLYPATDRQRQITEPAGTPRKLLGQTDQVNPCLPDPPPPYHDIYGQAKSRNRIVWLLVHEGDQHAMVQALTKSAEQRGGYAVTRPSLFAQPSRVAILASDRWHRDHLDALRPYGNRPNLRDGDDINAGYVRWATTVAQTPDPQPEQRAPEPCELRPTVIAVNRKPVGQTTDYRTRTGAWLLIGFAATLAISGRYALRPMSLTR